MKTLPPVTAFKVDVTSPAVLADLADVLTSTVQRAGQAIMKVYISPFAVNQKSDLSPVTEADEVAEKIILADLALATPDIPVVAEESVAAGKIPHLDGGPFWLVDPLDGTKEFIKRNGEFTVNIGLIVAGVPVLGLVFAPALDELWLGWSMAGQSQAWHWRHGTKKALRVRAVPPEGMTVLASRSHGDTAALDTLLAPYKVAAVQTAGSSLKFCRLAEGAADFYPRLLPTSEWDTAAGHAVLAAAGGSVTTVDGGFFAYSKPQFLNGSFVAKGTLP